MNNTLPEHILELKRLVDDREQEVKRIERELRDSEAAFADAKVKLTDALCAHFNTEKDAQYILEGNEVQRHCVGKIVTFLGFVDNKTAATIQVKLLLKGSNRVELESLRFFSQATRIYPAK